MRTRNFCRKRWPEGWEILKQVRAGERTRALPVLVISGLTHLAAEEARALGADEFLAKPVSIQVLVDTVGRLLSRPTGLNAGREG